jgi:hypothetical protein
MCGSRITSGLRVQEFPLNEISFPQIRKQPKNIISYMKNNSVTNEILNSKLRSPKVNGLKKNTTPRADIIPKIALAAFMARKLLAATKINKTKQIIPKKVSILFNRIELAASKITETYMRAILTSRSFLFIFTATPPTSLFLAHT